MYLNSAKAEVWSLEFFNTWWDTDEKQDSSCHIAGCCGLDEVRRAGAPRCLKTCLTRDLCDLYRFCWASNLFASQLSHKILKAFRWLQPISSWFFTQTAAILNVKLFFWVRDLLVIVMPLGLCKGKPWHWRSHVVRLAPGSRKSGGVTHEIRSWELHFYPRNWKNSLPEALR